MVLIHIEIENKIHPNLKSWKEPAALKPATLYLQKPEMPDIARVWPWVKRHIPVRPPPPSCHNGSQSQARPLQPSHYHTLSTCHLPARRNGNNQQHHSHPIFLPFQFRIAKSNPEMANSRIYPMGRRNKKVFFRPKSPIGHHPQ